MSVDVSSGEWYKMKTTLDKVLQIESHITPYSLVPKVTSDFYQLSKVTYRRGIYRMEEVLGYEYFQVMKPIIVTKLQFRNTPEGKWEPLMVDDPLHWLGMKELASKCTGNVLVGGLGMGLILYHLLENKSVQSITIIEIDSELTSFIQPYLPKDRKIKVVHANYFNYVTKTLDMYNSAVIDLWVLSEKSSNRHNVAQSMSVAKALTSNISTKVFIWGVKGQFN